MEAHGRWLRSDDAKPSYTTDCVVVAAYVKSCKKNWWGFELH